MIFAPKLNLVVDPDSELLLLDRYLPLVQAKTANDRVHQLDASKAKQLEEIVERIGAFAREKYGDEQGQRITDIGASLGRAVTSEDEIHALLRKALNVVTDARRGHGEPISNELRGSLERYCRLVGAYYVELKCKHLRRRSRHMFWEAIVTLHDSLLYHSLLGTTEAKHIGETAPDQVSKCSKQTRDFVRAGYKELMNARGNTTNLLDICVTL